MVPRPRPPRALSRRPARRPSAAALWAGAVRDVLFPRGCAGCGMPDETLCPSCAAALGDPRPFPLAGTVAGGVACGSYTGPVRRAVLAWKDHGDCGCDAPFAAALCTLLAQEELAAAPLRSRGVRTKAVQRSRVGQRSGRLEGHLVLSRRGSRADRDVPVLLVDDIVTTGATLRSCVAALSAAGFTVVGAIALARTPDKGDAGQREGQRDGGVSRAAAVCAAA